MKFTIKPCLLLFTLILLFIEAVTNAAGFSPTDSLAHLEADLKAHNINCDGFTPSLSPSLNFQAFSSDVKINGNQTLVSIYLRIYYYRCKVTDHNEGLLAVVDPDAPYTYKFTQLDESTTTVRVTKQGYKFVAIPPLTPSSSAKTTLPARVSQNNYIQNVQFDIPIERLFRVPQIKKLKDNKSLTANFQVKASLFIDYQVGEGSSDTSAPVPKFRGDWTIKILKSHGKLEAVLEKGSFTPIE